jgi:uncharacterized protein (TIGR02594 family)
MITKISFVMCSIALISSPAEAKPLRHHAKAVHSVELTDVSAARRHRNGLRRHVTSLRSTRLRRATALAPAASMPDRHGIGDQVSTGAIPAFGTLFGSGVVAEARRYVGTNPTGRSKLWCGHFMNMVLARSGRAVSNSNMARSFASYGQRVSGPQVGAIAVMSRGRRGGHVGVVSGIDANGNPIIISGNHKGRVAETVYPRGRIYAYVMP